MAKRTAIIDIGSNSIRLVIYERTSRFGFYLLNETKSRVRISEGAYENGGNLQPPAIKRAIEALSQFLCIIKNYKARKILCVATSAVRDAPNKKEFISLAQKKLGLKIKVINGNKEALLGGVAAANLLPFKDGITIDIGGGSTELALIKNRSVKSVYSLDIGTVRLKELFFDKKIPIEATQEYIVNALNSIPSEFKSEIAIGIGGTVRALSKAILQRNRHPLNKLHAFSYKVEDEKTFLKKVAHSPVLKLSKYGIKKDRLDTIRPGALIFINVIEKISAKRVITSGAGVREGLFLTDILRSSNSIFPSNFNPSIRSLQDRFCLDKKLAANIANSASVIFDVLQEPFNLPVRFKKDLIIAAKLSQIGIKLDFYSYHKHSAYMIVNELDYGFTHEEMTLISALVRFHKKRLPKDSFIKEFKPLLPSENIFLLLSYIVSLAQAIHASREYGKIKACYEKEVLTIKMPFNFYLAKERIKELKKPLSIAIKLEHTHQHASQ